MHSKETKFLNRDEPKSKSFDHNMKGPWSVEEQKRFLEALLKFGKDWAAITDHVGTRDIGLVRSHG